VTGGERERERERGTHPRDFAVGMHGCDVKGACRRSAPAVRMDNFLRQIVDKLKETKYDNEVRCFFSFVFF